MTRSWTYARISLLVLLLFPARLSARQSWQIDAYAGGAVYDGVAASVGSNNAVLGVRYADVSWLYASLAAPLAGGDPAWGAAGAGRRLLLRSPRLAQRRLHAGFDLAAHGFGYHDPGPDVWGRGATLEALPFVALGVGSHRLELHTGARHHVVRFDDESLERTTFDTGFRLASRAIDALELSAEATWVRAPNGDFPFAGVAASWEIAQRATLRAAVGRWFDDALPSLAWSGSAAVAVTPLLEVWGAFRSEPGDPLYWSAPRRSWSVGLTRRLGSPAPAVSPLQPVVSGNLVTIRIPLQTAAQPPFVAGDFSDWEAVPMQRQGDFWVAQLHVRPGVHHYAFRTADGRWFVPPAMPGRREDGFGGHVAVLVIE